MSIHRRLLSGESVTSGYCAAQAHPILASPRSTARTPAYDFRTSQAAHPAYSIEITTSTIIATTAPATLHGLGHRPSGQRHTADWFCRKTLLTDFKGSLTRVIWPAVSASFLYFIAIYSIPTFDPLTTVVGIGGIAIGLVPLGLNRWRIHATS